MHFENVRQWQGTAKALAQEMKRQIEQLHLSVDSPAVRTVRLWRSKQLMSQPKGKEFGFRQILEGLSTALLLEQGWTLAAIGQVLPSFSDEDLERQIIAEAGGISASWSPTKLTTSQKKQRPSTDLAEDAVVLLAQGILQQYTRVLNREIVRQEDNMPPEIYRSMCKLGRLYIEQGLPDKAACIHAVLERARYRLDDKWDLETFRQPAFRFSDVILIDPE